MPFLLGFNQLDIFVVRHHGRLSWLSNYIPLKGLKPGYHLGLIEKLKVKFLCSKSPLTP